MFEIFTLAFVKTHSLKNKKRFGTKIALFGCFWTVILGNYCLFERIILRFIKAWILTNTVNFGIGCTFSRGPGPFLCPLYKVDSGLEMRAWALILISQDQGKCTKVKGAHINYFFTVHRLQFIYKHSYLNILSFGRWTAEDMPG